MIKEVKLTREKKSFTCPNSKCKRTFDSLKHVEYYACPYCLTEIKETSTSGCKHYFGYLSERPKGQEIPAECITCEKSLECMLKSMEGKAVKEIGKWYR